jgi:hypothetical protein
VVPATCAKCHTSTGTRGVRVHWPDRCGDSCSGWNADCDTCHNAAAVALTSRSPSPRESG